MRSWCLLLMLAANRMSTATIYNNRKSQGFDDLSEATATFHEVTLRIAAQCMSIPLKGACKFAIGDISLPPVRACLCKRQTLSNSIS